MVECFECVSSGVATPHNFHQKLYHFSDFVCSGERSSEEEWRGDGGRTIPSATINYFDTTNERMIFNWKPIFMYYFIVAIMRLIRFVVSDVSRNNKTWKARFLHVSNFHSIIFFCAFSSLSLSSLLLYIHSYIWVIFYSREDWNNDTVEKQCE